MKNEVFEAFDHGRMAVVGKTVDFDTIKWTKHPIFEGVELKHIITGSETDGEFSYHLVRVAPGKRIGNHIHETQLETHEVIAGDGFCINDNTRLEYRQGVISIIPAGIEHEVSAGADGLYMFAKFMPPLC